MSAPSFTPGEWHYFSGSHSIWSQADGKGVRCICIVKGPRKNVDAERDANARLIVAAPELYDALSDLLAKHESAVRSFDCPKVAAARAAIAKVRGSDLTNHGLGGAA